MAEHQPTSIARRAMHRAARGPGVRSRAEHRGAPMRVRDGAHAGGAMTVALAPAGPSSVARGTALATAVSAVGILPAYLAGALGPQIRADLGIGPAAIGLALSACFVSQSLFSARRGRIVD